MFKYGQKTYIMGILNVTPDSFSDGGSYTDVDVAVEHAKEMIKEGADIIDVGGESTRPGHKFVSSEEEIKRIVPVIKNLKKEVHIPLSIDTYKADVAEEALKLGVDMVNDVWGLTYDGNMADVIGKYNASVCIMHNQENTEYDKDIIESIKEFLQNSIDKALNAGVKKENIVLDKNAYIETMLQNLEVLKRLNELQDLGYPILLGTSRKSVLGNIVGGEPKERVEATVATTVSGIRDGVDIVRVHDVKENIQAAKVADKLYRG